MYAEIEARLWSSPEMESVTLRYGFFYGPGTWYARDGAAAAHVRNQQTPITGDGSGVWSWVHIEDAARATVAALTVPSGIYNIVDDNPSPLSSWLPAFAQWLGAPPPLHATVQETREAAGEDAVYYATRLNGASNEKVKHTLGFQPRLLEWLTDFPNDKQTPSTKELRNS
jgi:nucleoside-diphosphate-sugar epimerase